MLNACPDDSTFVDLFGGSGLLSHFVKTQKPSATVVYNDFDNYAERLANIGKTNALLTEIRPLLADAPKDKKVPDDIKQKVLEVVLRADKAGFVDYITLSVSLLFSGKRAVNFAELSKETMYNVCKATDYNADGYLAGVERVAMDYKALFAQYKAMPNVVFLVDPPYLGTTSKSYRSDGTWDLTDYLDVLNVVDGHNYVYFTSNKSQVIELCDWLGKRKTVANPFNGAVTKTVTTAINYNSNYTDVMVYKV